MWCCKKRTVNMALIGLKDSGKTALLYFMKNEKRLFISPTYGFTCHEVPIKFKNYKLQIYDLGGSDAIREYWSNYYGEVHGIIFVIDSSDKSKLQLIENIFSLLSKNKLLNLKPLLILSNKQDLKNVESITISEIETSIAAATYDNNNDDNTNNESNYKWPQEHKIIECSCQRCKYTTESTTSKKSKHRSNSKILPQNVNITVDNDDNTDTNDTNNNNNNSNNTINNNNTNNKNNYNDKECIKNGLNWMLSIIDKNYNQLCNEIQQNEIEYNKTEEKKLISQELRVEKYKQDEINKQQTKHVKAWDNTIDKLADQDHTHDTDNNVDTSNIDNNKKIIEKVDNFNDKNNQYNQNDKKNKEKMEKIEKIKDIKDIDNVSNKNAVSYDINVNQMNSTSPINPIGHLLNENDILSDETKNEKNQSVLIRNSVVSAYTASPQNNDNVNNDIQSILDDIENQISARKTP